MTPRCQAPADRIGNEFRTLEEERLAALASRASEVAQERTDEDAYDLANILKKLSLSPEKTYF